MDGGWSNIFTLLLYVVPSVLGIAIPILLIERYAASKGLDQRTWSWRALLLGPAAAAVLLAFSKPASPKKFMMCPVCNKPIKVESTTCIFCEQQRTRKTTIAGQ